MSVDQHLLNFREGLNSKFLLIIQKLRKVVLLKPYFDFYVQCMHAGYLSLPNSITCSPRGRVQGMTGICMAGQRQLPSRCTKDPIQFKWHCRHKLQMSFYSLSESWQGWTPTEIPFSILDAYYFPGYGFNSHIPCIGTAIYNRLSPQAMCFI